MRAHPWSRAALALSSIAMALLATREQTALGAGIVLAGFVLAGEARFAARLVLVMVPFVLFSAGLWLFVGGVDWTAPVTSLTTLVAPGAPFLGLLRALTGSAGIVLALATVPDGEAVTLLRRFGFPASTATMLASGGAIAGTIGESFTRSFTALRAQGSVGPGAFARLRGLGAIVALTWVSSLSITLARAECKWSGNRFLQRLAPPPVRASAMTAWGTLVLLSACGALIGVLVGGVRVDHLL